MSAHAEHVIGINDDGSMVALWTEAIPLSDFGNMSISRASTIEFNNVSGMWEVVIAGETEPRCISRSRDFCLQWEHEYVNGLIAKGKI